MFNCFEEDPKFDLMDKDAFKFTHKLLGHPTLSLENLASVLPKLKDRVVYSKDLLSINDDFEGTFKQSSKEKTLEEVIETIRTSNSYIMVNGPEADSSFQDLHRLLVSDVEVLMQKLGVGKKAIDSKLYLFIASPNSITPFHIDRYSTFLMQFRGSKLLSVFPQWNEQAVSSQNREAYVTYSNTKLPFNAEIDALGTCFDFAPGEALHIPFIAGHHVKNGPDDVSISMSIIFNTEQSMAWRRALRFNFAARKFLSPIGIKPHAIGQSPIRDKIKAKAWNAFTKIRGHYSVLVCLILIKKIPLGALFLLKMHFILQT
jgi:Cupin-like domain